MKLISRSFQETERIGEKIGKIVKNLLRKEKNNSFLISLYGDLGGGKTTFVKGIAKGLGIKKNITSPTFNLIKEYKIEDLYLFHFDLYRLKKETEFLNLGFNEYFQRPKSISVIEWADKIEPILPFKRLIIKFKFINQNCRELIFKPQGTIYQKLINNI